MQSNNNQTFFRWQNVIRAVYSAIIPLAFLYVCHFPSFSSLLVFLPALIISAFLYLVPLFVSLSKIKSENLKSIKPLIAEDAVFSLSPAIVICFFTSLFIYLFFDGFELVWFFSPIIMCVLLLLTLYFWLMYLFNNTVVKRVKKPVRKE